MKIKRSFSDFLFVMIFFLVGHVIISQDQLSAPTTSFEKFDLPGGSLGNSVQTMVQDTLGFMWYASKNGLHRWDGYQFKTYQNDPDDSTTIAGNHVEEIYLSEDGSMWLGVGWGTDRGLLDHFDQRTGTFTHYDYQPDLKINRDAYNLAAIVEDDEGNIWTGTHYGVYKLDPKTGIFKQYLNDPDNPYSLSHNICRSIYKDSYGTLWFGTGLFWDQSPEGGLNRYRPESDDFLRYFHDPNDVKSLKSNVITDLFEDSSGNFWIGTIGGGLHKMNKEEGTFQRIPEPEYSSFNSSISLTNLISNTFVQFIFEGQKNKLWIGYFNGGLLYYDPLTETKRLFEADQSIPGSLPEKYVWSMYQSQDGSLWGSTTGPESSVFKIKQSDFNTYTLASPTNFIGALCESAESNLWVGTHESGLLQLDIKSNRSKFFKTKSIRSATLSEDYDTDLINKNDVLNKIIKIVEDTSGELWMIRDLYPGAIRFNPDNEAVITYAHDPNDESSIGNGFVTDIIIDNKGRLWIITSKGDLNLYNAANDGFTKFKYTSLIDDRLDLGYHCQLLQSDSGDLLIAGTGEDQGQLPPFMSYFNPDKKNFRPVEISFTSTELGIIDKEIIQLVEDRSENIWFCTHEHLICVNPKVGQINMYHANNFGSEFFKGMALDQQGLLWMIGENISYFNPLIDDLSPSTAFANTIKNFPGYKQTVLSANDGNVYIGGEGSFNSFTPALIVNNYRKIPPKSIITDFLLLDQSEDNNNSWNQNLYSDADISLDHDQNSFSIRFATLSFDNPQQNKIQYRLDGYDDQWRTAGLDPVATYVKVPPGGYTFLVKGATASSDWGNTRKFNLHISPPFWATWWAYSLYGIMGLGFLYSLNRFQLKRRLEKAETFRLKELDTTKNRLFTNISHEFRTPLTVISGMSSQIKENPEKWLDEGATIIERNCARLLDLVNQMLDLSKLESGTLGLQLVQSDSIPFVKYLCESFNSLTEESKINLMVYAEIEELYMDFDPQKLSTIVINLLSNAIKFTMPGGKIIVHLNRIDNNGKAFFLVKIKDNGSGISEDDLENIFDRFYQVDNSSTRIGEGTGIGLALTKELTELMDGSIEVKSVLGKGSEFIVQLPISRNEPITNDLLISHRTPSKQILIPPIDWEEKVDLPLALIIEDNVDVANYLKVCLEEKYNLVYAKDGEEGIEMAYDRIPDIIISDVMMPGKDGFEVCSILKNDERTNHIPIVLLTAKASLQDKISGISHGADAYLVKPFNKAELFTRLEQLMLLRQKMMNKVQQGSYSLLLKRDVEGAEASFLKKAVDHIHAHIGDHAFGSPHLAHKLLLSESQVYRKLKAITGKSTAVFIRSVRLQKARELIMQGNDAISAIAYDVGFNDPSWFSRAFKEEFGYSPSELSK